MVVRHFTAEERWIEEWRPFIDAPSYEVSSLGRVRRAVPTERCAYIGHVLRAHPNSHGYLSVTLYIGRHRKHRLVHTAVAHAFLGPRPEGLVINHKDGDRLNARVSNLEYVTSGENNQHARDVLGTMTQGFQHGARHRNVKLAEDQVREIANRLAAGATQREVAAEFGVIRQTISNIVCGKHWKHLNLTFPSSRSR